MKPIDPHAFDRKQAEAAPAPAGHDAHVIRSQMNRGDWLILGILALIWGGAFFFIGVAVRHVQPLTYVWLRLTIAAAGMWAFLAYKGGAVGLPRKTWGALVAHFLTHDERMNPRKVAGVILGFAGVATMIGPSLLSNLGSNALAQLACVTAALLYALAAVWA